MPTDNASEIKKRERMMTIRVPVSAMEKLPRETLELARSRTEFLIGRLQYQPLTELFAAAWVQGVRDAAMATEKEIAT